MNKTSKIFDSFKDNSNQIYQTFIADQNSTSLDISKLDLIEPIKSHVNKIKIFFDQIEQLENDNINDCKNFKQNIKISKEIIQEYIIVLDFLNVSLIENNSWKDKYNECAFENKELQRRIILEKESQAELKKKYEDDELQNEEENFKKEKLINDLQLKLKKLETEKNKIIEENQDLKSEHQIELNKLEKEKSKLIFLNKKIINEKELEEIESSNRKNSLIVLKKEIRNLFNLANLHRKKELIFGKKFLESLDFLRNSKYELSISKTFIDASINNSLKIDNDFTHEDLSSFNYILNEKLSQDNYGCITQEESYINNSSLVCPEVFANNFENRLFGNETFRTNSLCVSNIYKNPHWTNIIAEEIFNECIANEVRLKLIKALLEIDQSFDHSSNKLNFVCKDYIKFMYKPENKSIADISYEDIHNRFEESFTENLAKNCNLTANKDQEVVKLILENKEPSFIEKDLKKMSPVNSCSSFGIFNDKKLNLNNDSSKNSNDSIENNSNSQNSKNLSNFNLTNVFKELSSNNNELLNSTVKAEENFKNLNLTFNKTEKLLNKTNTSSEMSLSEDCSLFNQAHLNEFSINSLDESDPVAINLMMSQNGSIKDMDDYFSNIKDDSNYEIENMDLTYSQPSETEIKPNPTKQNKIVEQKFLKEPIFSKKKNHNFNSMKKSSTSKTFKNFIHPSNSLFKNIIYVFYLIIIMLIYFLSQNISLKMNYSSWENYADNLLNFFCYGFN